MNGFVVDGFNLVDVRILWLEGLSGVPDFLTGDSLPAELPDFPGRLFLDFENPSFPGILFSVNFPNLSVTRAPTLVSVDIEPGDDDNEIEPGDDDDVRVAILGSMDFDALQVNESTVRFGPSEAITQLMNLLSQYVVRRFREEYE